MTSLLLIVSSIFSYLSSPSLSTFLSSSLSSVIASITIPNTPASILHLVVVILSFIWICVAIPRLYSLGFLGSTTRPVNFSVVFNNIYSQFYLNSDCNSGVKDEKERVAPCVPSFDQQKPQFYEFINELHRCFGPLIAIPSSTNHHPSSASSHPSLISIASPKILHYFKNIFNKSNEYPSPMTNIPSLSCPYIKSQPLQITNNHTIIDRLDLLLSGLSSQSTISLSSIIHRSSSTLSGLFCLIENKNFYYSINISIKRLIKRIQNINMMTPSDSRILPLPRLMSTTAIEMILILIGGEWMLQDEQRLQSHILVIQKILINIKNNNNIPSNNLNNPNDGSSGSGNGSCGNLIKEMESNGEKLRRFLLDVLYQRQEFIKLLSRCACDGDKNMSSASSTTSSTPCKHPKHKMNHPSSTTMKHGFEASVLGSQSSSPHVSQRFDDHITRQLAALLKRYESDESDNDDNNSHNNNEFIDDSIKNNPIYYFNMMDGMMVGRSQGIYAIDEHVIDDVIALLFEGVPPLQSLFTQTIAYLSMLKNVQGKAVSEIQRVHTLLEEKSSIPIDDDDSHTDYYYTNNLGCYKYIWSIVNETLRHDAPIPYVIRLTTETVTIPVEEVYGGWKPGSLNCKTKTPHQYLLSSLYDDGWNGWDIRSPVIVIPPNTPILFHLSALMTSSIPQAMLSSSNRHQSSVESSNLQTFNPSYFYERMLNILRNNGGLKNSTASLSTDVLSGSFINYPSSNTKSELSNSNSNSNLTSSEVPLPFCPFGVGSRVCPGRSFASIATVFLVIKLLLKFKFSVILSSHFGSNKKTLNREEKDKSSNIDESSDDDIDDINQFVSVVQDNLEYNGICCQGSDKMVVLVSPSL